MRLAVRIWRLIICLTCLAKRTEVQYNQELKMFSVEETDLLAACVTSTANARSSTVT